MAIQDDILEDLKISLSGIINLEINKEILYPKDVTGKIWISKNKNWKLADYIPRIFKNGNLITVGFDITNDEDTGYGTVTFTAAQSSSDKIEASYIYEVYSDSELTNFMKYACKDTSVKLMFSPTKYVLDSLLDTDPVTLIKSISRLRVLKDLQTRAYTLVNSKIGEVYVNRNELFKNIASMIVDEEKEINSSVQDYSLLNIGTFTPVNEYTILKNYNDGDEEIYKNV